MPRTAILLTLIAATFFGPLLCCCALGLRCPAQALPVDEPAPVAAKTCSHCQSSEPPTPKPTKSKDECPVCLERATMTTYVEVKPAPLPDASTWVAWLPLEAVRPVDRFSVTTVAVLPLPDPRTYFLDSCHRLRC